MADKASEKPEAAATATDAQDTSANNATATEASAKEDDVTKGDEETTKGDEKEQKSDEKQTDGGDEKPAADASMKEATDAPIDDAAANETTAEAANEEAVATATPETPAGKGKGRRKSTGETKKALNRKNSKARLSYPNAKPGDYFLIKLKGFPAWPAIVCDESMLPLALVNSRPVSAARADGTYTEAYADGGKRSSDRSFPVMYLHTNEFGWVANTSLSELTPEKAEDMLNDKMRKDLKEAFQLAIENNPLDHYKEILKNFQEELIAQEEARKEAAATPKKSKKGKAKAVEADEDLDMPDADSGTKAKSKKRKAEEVSTPQRPESVKKPKIKLNTSTPKANGTTPKAKEESATKAKSKAKKATDKKSETKEPKLTAEERRTRKRQEVLYLRHKLQRGLLTRDQQPQENEMKSMSEYITMLENFKELEVATIRSTKINKVLKAILKLESIPREEDFNFKGRSQTLLDKWNTMLAAEPAPAANGDAAPSAKSKDAEPKKDDSEKPAEDAEEQTAPATKESKEDEKTVTEKETAAPESMEATA